MRASRLLSVPWREARRGLEFLRRAREIASAEVRPRKVNTEERLERVEDDGALKEGKAGFGAAGFGFGKTKKMQRFGVFRIGFERPAIVAPRRGEIARLLGF